MKRARLAAFVAVVLVAPHVMGDEPPDQYAFFSGEDTTITDNFTKLVWNRSPLAATYGYSPAQIACTGGTRVPALKELLTLVDEAPHQEHNAGTTISKYIPFDAFGYAYSPTDKLYWTSTAVDRPSSGPPTKGYAVDFATGLVQKVDVNTMLYVRCVK
jgi:hypothetical protein